MTMKNKAEKVCEIQGHNLAEFTSAGVLCTRCGRSLEKIRGELPTTPEEKGK
jgi:hypothetical protein